jgi:hypothetical protein
MSDYDLLLEMAAVPLFLLAVAAVAAYFLRRSVERSMKINFLSGTTSEVEERLAVPNTCERPRLSFRRLNLSSTLCFRAPTAAIVSKVTRRHVLAAFYAAALAYSAITTSALVVGMYSLHHYHTDVLVALTYLLQWPNLIVVLWLTGIPLRTKISVLGIYFGLGLLLTTFASSVYHAALLAEAMVSFIVFSPLAGVIPLLIRKLRPWLLAMVAVILFLSLGTIPLVLLKVNTNIPQAESWSLVLGIGYVALAVFVVGWMLRRNSWKLPLSALTTLLLLAILFISLHKLTIGFILIGLSSNVAQVFVVWSIFKALVHLQEREFLPSRVLHSHLSWGVLTLYLLAVVLQTRNLYGQRWWQPWAIALAYAVYLGILHVSLHRIWRARVKLPGKRLLLLRVFGAADKRESLLDWLEDTWCLVGRIDLIASTDLAVRTLGSRMLESFLLRRTDKQFLHTNTDVDQRLSHLRSELEGDARYPINSVYCYASAWRHAVEHLAPESDVVLMDLRGFTSKNQGCIFELDWIVPNLDLTRIVLLTDASTDYPTLENVVQRAWTSQPSDSPNASKMQPVLTMLNVAQRSSSNSRDLFMFLLSAAGLAEEQRRVGSVAA